MDLENDIKKLVKTKVQNVRALERCNRLSFEISAEEWKRTIETMYHENLLSFTTLKLITSSKLNENEYKVSIELHSQLRGESVNISTKISEDETLDSVSTLWAYADWFEYEVNQRSAPIINGLKSKNPFGGTKIEYSH